MAVDWNSKETKFLKFTLSILIDNMDNSKNIKEKNRRVKTINAISQVLKSRGEM